MNFARFATRGVESLATASHDGAKHSLLVPRVFFCKAITKKWKDGCCCVSALVANNVVYIANLGDCSAVLCRRDAAPLADQGGSPASPKPSAAADFGTRWGSPPAAAAKKLTTDHTLLLATERARIVAAGGRVQDNRVDGIMEVSRSMGDVRLRKSGVIGEPDCRIHFKITPADEFLLLACDGLWSVFDPSSAVTYVRQRIWVRTAAVRVVPIVYMCITTNCRCHPHHSHSTRLRCVNVRCCFLAGWVDCCCSTT